jgi:phosphate/sulfate permease
MPKWFRITLIMILAFLGAGLWGFIATAVGAPTIVVSLGAVVIGAVVLTQAFRGNSN